MENENYLSTLCYYSFANNNRSAQNNTEVENQQATRFLSANRFLFIVTLHVALI